MEHSGKSGQRSGPVSALQEIASYLAVQAAAPILRVAIDGVDGVAKTTFGDLLAEALRSAGREVIRSSVDGFHNPRSIRYRLGRTPEGFYRDSYDYQGLTRNLLDPLSEGGSLSYRSEIFDHVSDSAVDTPVHRAAVGSVFVFDGLFLHRPELRAYWVGSRPRRTLRSGPSFGTRTAKGRPSVRDQIRPNWTRAILVGCVCAGAGALALFGGLFGVALLFDRAPIAVSIGVLAVAGSAWLAAVYTAYMLNACATGITVGSDALRFRDGLSLRVVRASELRQVFLYSGSGGWRYIRFVGRDQMSVITNALYGRRSFDRLIDEVRTWAANNGKDGCIVSEPPPSEGQGAYRAYRLRGRLPLAAAYLILLALLTAVLTPMHALPIVR